MRLVFQSEDEERARAMRLLRQEIRELREHRNDLAAQLTATRQRECAAVEQLRATRTAVSEGHRRMVARMNALAAENERLRAAKGRVSLVKESVGG